MKTLKFAVVGTGHLGRIHARLIQSLENVELVGIVDPDESARRQVAGDLDTWGLSDYRPLLGKIDGAVVATPTRFHHQVSRELLEQGVHLLVEKPITSTVEEADELIEAAANKQTVLQVGHIERFNPAFATATEVGRPRYIEAVRASGYTFRSIDVGVVLDLMIHDIDLIRSLVAAPVVDIQAVSTTVFGPHEDMAQARLTFADGTVANVTAARTSPEGQRSMRIIGDLGVAELDFSNRSSRIIRPDERLSLGHLDVHSLSAEEKAHIRDHLFEEMLPIEERVAPESNALLDELADFARAIRTGIAPRVDGTQGREALTTALDVVAAAQAHRWSDDWQQTQAAPSILPGSYRKAG